jgi:hypothetical protein
VRVVLGRRSSVVLIRSPIGLHFSAFLGNRQNKSKLYFYFDAINVGNTYNISNIAD